ncbi:MAG TPA: tetratricopeptide repeat protein [Nannocystaceae bacterium]|nr:tetratricopeptide repeat protein [Nannocystaceae bacterium]
MPPRAPARAPDVAATSVTDLPTPVDRASAQSFKVPTIDLPTPARPSVAPFRAPEPPPFQSSGADDLELSLPVDDDDFTTSADSDGGMISVAELDLPAPAGIIDLPAPAGVVDLPQPIGLDLPAPADAGLLTPADTGLLTPADQGVQPAHNLPAPADQALQPTSARRGGAAQASGAAAPTARSIEADRVGLDPTTQRRSPAPRAIGSSGARRPLFLALGGLALVGVCVGGAYAIGMFDPPEDIPVNTGRKPIAKDGKQGDTKAPIAPASTAIERDAATLALLARDTPQGYIEAIASAEKAGDRVGQAEAALLMNLRYGPDSARATSATTWLEPYAAQTEPFVRRVLGLVALGGGALEQADGMLAGDDTKTRLYRGWLRLRQSRATDAVSEADAVIALKPDDTGALVLRHAARAQLDPRGELAPIEASLAKLPGHTGLLVVGVRAATAAGELRRARAWLDAIAPVEGTSKGWDGSKLRLRGDLELAAGALPTAAKLYEAALAAAPEDRELALARVRVLIAANRVGDAETAIRKLVEAKPDDIDALLLQAEVFVAAGKGDDAKTLLDNIEKAAPGRARTSYLLGLVHSMRAETEAGRTAFAAAVQRDPTLLEATIAEARVLADGDKLAEALAVLDTARKNAADRGSERDEAAILRAKAAMLAKAGQAAAAAAALDQALEADPLDNAAQLARGLAKLESGDYAGGKADLLALYERTGPMAGLIAPLGRIFVREGSLTELEALVGGVIDDPDALPEVLIVAARLRLAQAKADDAKTILQRVLDMLPNDWEANLLLAQAMLDSQDYPGALVQVDRSTPAVPSAEKFLLRGKILEFNGKHAEARPEYLRALKIDPALTEARFLYGRLLAFANESHGAIDELGKVVAEAPDKYAEAWESLGRAQRDLGEQEAAVKSLEKALALDETLFTASYLLGRLRFERNEMAKAVSALEKATDERHKDKDNYADAWVFLARAQAKSGAKASAVASYKKFLELAPAGHPSRSDAEKQIQALR